MRCAHRAYSETAFQFAAAFPHLPLTGGKPAAEEGRKS
jgi:hypothetical protein